MAPGGSVEFRVTELKYLEYDNQVKGDRYPRDIHVYDRRFMFKGRFDRLNFVQTGIYFDRDYKGDRHW